ncbi:MAG TPA: LPO_1073/Vpar_1526 family protein [Cellvibrio sp.]
MLGKDQDQVTSGGSTALQAGRDINYHGLSVAEVRELCTLFLRNNFPALREEARQAAEEHVRSFAATLEKSIVDNASSIVMEKFKDPDVQATINDAFLASARKGSAASPDILCSLISERVSRQSSDLLDIVISEAVQVVPRLTKSQISLLSFVHFVKSVGLSGRSSLAEIAPYGQAAISFSHQAFGLSEIHHQHLAYAGVASLNPLVGGDIYDELNKATYSYFGFKDCKSFKDALLTQAPSWVQLLDQFNNDNLFRINLTSVGQAIAIANISQVLGNLDYKIWIN